MTNVDAVVSMAQVLLRYRHAAKIISTINGQTIEDTAVEITNLLNADVYRVTLGERLQATLELNRRMVPA